MTQPSTHNEPNVTNLLQQLINYKAAEERARANRIEAEQALLPFLESRDEGSVTTEIDGFKVTVTKRMNRRCSAAGFAAIRQDVPEALRPIKVKDALDEAGVRWLRDNEPELYARIAKHITATPGKPTLTIKVPLTEVA